MTFKIKWMNYPTDILSLLRSSSKSIHDEINEKGISKAMANQSMDEKIYLTWLYQTYTFINAIKLLFDSNSTFDKLIKYNVTLELMQELEKDINSFSDSDMAESLYNFDPVDHEDLMLSPVYTLLGSMMGANMINHYISKNHSKFPVNFVSKAATLNALWKEFLNEIQNYSLQIDAPKLEDYNKKVWLKILENTSY